MQQLNISQVEAGVDAAAELDKQLLVLRLNLGKLRAAFERAFAPVLNLVLPVLDQAARAVTDFVSSVAAVLTALFGQVQKEATTTVKTTGSGVKGALADFDRLDRLSFGSGGSSLVTIPGDVKKLPEALESVVEKLRELLAPLEAIDLSKAKKAFEELRHALEPLTRELFAGLEWAWFNLLVPISRWAAEQALPAFLRVLAEAARLLGAVITGVKPVLQWFWESFLVPLGRWVGDGILAALEFLRQRLENLTAAAQGLKPRFTDLTGALDALRSRFGLSGEGLDSWNGRAATAGGHLKTMTVLAKGLQGAFVSVGSAVSSVSQTLAGLFSGLTPGFKTMINGALELVNAALTAVEAGINSMVEIINSIGITIPDWVPKIGGKSLNLGLKEVALPRVPLLARGAVLPPNQPFLAVVGDQSHGTNIEAPLSLIEEAVAGVMGASLSGQDTANALLERILAAVEGITVGDETIGRAARRYEQRCALMGGVR